MYQQTDISRSFAQRRQSDRKDIQAVVQIHSETPFGDHFLETLVGGRNNARIHANGLRTTESLQLLFLNRTQEFWLKLDRQFANFIQEERPAVGGLKPSQALGYRPGERASLMSEKLALKQRGGNGRAVHRDEPLVPARAGVVNGPRDHFFTGSRLTLQQDRTVGGRYHLHVF